MTEFLLLIIAAGIGVLIFRKPGTQWELPFRAERARQPKRPREIVPPIPRPRPRPVVEVPPVAPEALKATIPPKVKPAGAPPSKASAVAMMILAIIYVISPIDFVPDVLPILGWIDDYGIFMAAKKYLANATKTPDMPV